MPRRATEKIPAEVGLHNTVSIPIKAIDIHLHLSQILVRQLRHFEIHQRIAVKEPITQNQVQVDVFLVEGKPSLDQIARAASEAVCPCSL